VEEPARLRQMITLWWHEAEKYGILRVLGGSPQPANADEMMVKPRAMSSWPGSDAQAILGEVKLSKFCP
jgi:hypothetical protein